MQLEEENQSAPGATKYAKPVLNVSQDGPQNQMESKDLASPS
jgi:hypothetical protein